MPTLQIHDLDERGVLAVSLARLLDLLAPQSREAEWTVSPVSGREPGEPGFEVIGLGAANLEKLAAEHAVVPGANLAALAHATAIVPLSDATEDGHALGRQPSASSPAREISRETAQRSAPAAPDAMPENASSGVRAAHSTSASVRVATNEPQIVWGEFVARRPGESTRWVTLRVIDSTFWEIEADDDAVLAKIKASFTDVR